MIPRHRNPARTERTATAPYNFVPLPERVYSVEDGIEASAGKIKPWERHDEFIPGANHGWIDVKIVTLTPLFIRGAISQHSDGSWDNREARLRPEPFLMPDGRPAIPGSSLRGMIRTLLEILSFSKTKPVNDQKPFFRTVSDDRIGREYRARVLRGGQKPIGGFLRLQGDTWSIVPCEVLRIYRQLLSREGVPIQTGPNYSPNWDFQHRRCWVSQPAVGDEVDRITFTTPQDHDWKPARLVLTGNAPSKKREFVFLDSTSDSNPVAIPDSIWRRFHDEDQISRWQERAFPADQPENGCRRAPGHLRNGEPVFFLRDESERDEANPDGLVFLGRAQMFRFPYDLSPADLTPEPIRDAGLDLGEAMFGRVDKDKKAIRGRVFFEDAAASQGGPDWLDEVLVPRILSSPKVTTFQHYLTQDGTKDKDDLTTYLSGDQTTIRGQKLYWHRWSGTQGLAQVKETDRHDQLRNDLQGSNPRDSQHTIVRPVKAGVTFQGRIRFENLTDVELGALLYAIQLPEGCAHRLGMAKPLGLGSVRIAAQLHLIDRNRRYLNWTETGAGSDSGELFRNVFVEEMLRHAHQSAETMINRNHGLRRIARLDALYLLLAWEGRNGIEKTAYMELSQFRTRPVLPTPHAVMGKPEPQWNGIAPNPAKPSVLPDDERSRAERRGHPQPSHPATVAQPAKPAVKPVDKGQMRTGTLHRGADKHWVARFEGDDREAVITKSSKIAPDTPEGATAEFYIEEQSKRIGIKARFERLMESKRPS